MPIDWDDQTSSVSSSVSLSVVLQTDDLQRRPTKGPDYAAEGRRLAAVVREVANSPMDVLQRTAAEALLFCGAHSAGVSILAEDECAELLRRPAIVGPLAAYRHSSAPRRFSPDGVVLERNAPQLFRRPARYYSYLEEVQPGVDEMLLAPFHMEDRTVGAVWVVLHDDTHWFDAEDERRLSNLARCASAAYQVCVSLGALRGAEDPSQGLTFNLHRLRDSLRHVKPPERPNSSALYQRALSERERQVCALVAQGHTNKSIAEVLGLNEKTIATYRARATDKLGFRNRADIVRFALDEGWLQGD